MATSSLRVDARCQIGPERDALPRRPPPNTLPNRHSSSRPPAMAKGLQHAARLTLTGVAAPAPDRPVGSSNRALLPISIRKHDIGGPDGRRHGRGDDRSPGDLSMTGAGQVIHGHDQEFLLSVFLTDAWDGIAGIEDALMAEGSAPETALVV